MSGIFASGPGFIRIFRTGEFADRGGKLKVAAAIECGPFLVDSGKLVRGLDNTRDARRTFAATGSGNRGAIGFCSGAALAGLAEILALPLGDFKIQRAMNLDGGSSSAFWFKRQNGKAFSIGEQKYVRDFVAIAPKN